MRVSLKRVLFCVIIGGLIFNLYISYRVQHDADDHHQQVIGNEFLVLDWTGNEHIFREKNTIECDFSHINPAYCQSKFSESSKIERCTRLGSLIIHWTADRSRLPQANLVAHHSIHIHPQNLPRLTSEQFSMVYILESEIHSRNGEYWDQFDFPMWYNLEHSYPEPITYFDLKIYLKDLFAPIEIPFANKSKLAPIVWISSNCNAYNGRELFVKKLMSHIRIDSYGKCLNNIQSNDIRIRRKPNSRIYSTYKFVIAMENSNCEDYVTEKLIQALASTVIPIVAGRNGKPNYARFAPRHSYINVYDYKSIKDLANYLNYLSTNETAYNEYFWFRQSSPVEKKIPNSSLNDYLHLADEILGANSTVRQWLLTKERSRNKYCKLVEFIFTNDRNSIHQRKKIKQPKADEVCLPHRDLISYASKS